MSSDEITPENIQALIEKKAKKALLLPTIKISDVTYIPPDFLIEGLLVRDTVGFISASPGSTKTWLAWDMALSVATGTKCLGHFDTKKGKVLAFNAEDSPGAITKPRLEALANSRNIKLDQTENLHLIDVHTLMLDDEKTQAKIEHTIEEFKPDLVLLDPFRQLHVQNEDKASEMAPILSFLRQLQRKYKVTIILVCHERKGAVGESQGSRRADRTRGSNVLEGWRDTAIYMDKPDKDKKTSVSVYHRGYLATEAFLFELKVQNEMKDGVWWMVSAGLEYMTAAQFDDNRLVDLCILVLEFINKIGETTVSEVAEGVNRRKKDVGVAVQKLLGVDVIVKRSRKLLRKQYGNQTFLDEKKLRGELSGTVPF